MTDESGSAGAFDLTGFIIGVTAGRRGDDQAVMFGRLGAEVLNAPVLSTVEVPDPDLLRRRTAELIDRPVDYLIANTGLGIRTWLAHTEGWGQGDRLREALAATRIAARGPKAAGALTSGGLRTWWRSPSEQLADVVDHLAGEGLQGRRVAFQLHGDDGAEVVHRLTAAGASVIVLPVYEWAPPADPEPVRDLIERCCEGGIDAVTFTAGPQIRALLEAADRVGRRAQLLGAFNAGGVVAGCIGPVCAAVATGAGLTEPVVPENWRLGSLVKSVARALDQGRGGR